MRRTGRSAVGILLSIAMGALPGLIELVFGGATAGEFGRSALEGMVYSLCIAAPCCLTLPRVMCALDERALRVRMAVALALMGVFSVAGCGMANLILAAFHMIAWRDLASTYWWSLRVCLTITFTFGALMLAINTLRGRLEEAKEESHRRQIAEERERKFAAEARFASLESRVHPHFLFNTLNSISALVREDPAEAERMIERLAALLRFSLDSETAGVVPLGEELRIVRDYLEIEKVRFGVRLRYRIEASEAAAEQMVPALSVQTLVENSVKYAVGERRDGAEIVVTARVREGRLRVEVADDGPGFEPTLSMKPGHGLDLLERRLAALFGASASLEMSTADGRTLVAISVAA